MIYRRAGDIVRLKQSFKHGKYPVGKLGVPM